MSTFNAGYEAGYGAASQKALDLTREFKDGGIDLSVLIWELEQMHKNIKKGVRDAAD